MNTPPPPTPPPSNTQAPPTLSPATPPPAPTAPNPLRDEWQAVAPGLAQRSYTPNGNELAGLVAFRIDPAEYEFRVHYRPAAPLSLREWREELPDAELIVNANFFDENYRIVGLLISDGEVFGWPYTDRGGLFQVDFDGGVRIRANIREPYTSGEPIRHAVQAFPLLVIDGETATMTADSGRASRRTVIGMDESGQVVIMVTPFLGLSLTDLARYLPATDIGLTTAFALDGGRSTMISVLSAGYSVAPIDVIPAVLAVYRR